METAADAWDATLSTAVDAAEISLEASERTSDAMICPLETTEESLDSGTTTTGVAVAMMDCKLDAEAPMSDTAALTEEAAWDACDAMAFVAADWTDAMSEETLLNSLAAAGTITGVKGLKVS